MTTQREYQAAVEAIAKAATAILSTGAGEDIYGRIQRDVELSAWANEHWADVVRYTDIQDYVRGAVVASMAGDVLAEVRRIRG